MAMTGGSSLKPIVLLVFLHTSAIACLKSLLGLQGKLLKLSHLLALVPAVGGEASHCRGFPCGAQGLECRLSSCGAGA